MNSATLLCSYMVKIPDCYEPHRPTESWGNLESKKELLYSALSNGFKGYAGINDT